MTRRPAVWPAFVALVAVMYAGTAVATAATVTEFSAGITPGGAPGFIAAGPDGNLWFTESNIALRGSRPRFYGDRIGRITPAGVVTEFQAATIAGRAPDRITAGPDGNLWFTEFNGGGIGRITPAGTITVFPGLTPVGQTVGITAGPDGNLWFAALLGDGVGRITPTGKVTQFDVNADSDPLNIAAGPDGNLWFTKPDTAQVGRITPTGKVTLFHAGITTNSEPWAIAAGPHGNLWFTERSGDRVGRITPGGKVSEFSAGLTPGSSPEGIAAGPDGNLWFTEPGGNRLGRITPAGRIVEFSAGLTPNEDPGAIAAGPDGDLWFTATDSIGRLTTTVGPTLAVVTRQARLSSRGLTAVELRCGPGTGPCAGDFVVTTTINVPDPHHPGAKTPRTITLATSRFSLAAGRVARVRLALGPKARQRVARAQHGRLSTQARAISTGGDGHRTLTLIAPNVY